LRAKLEKMLAWPVQRQTTSKDGKTVVIEPARWSFQTIALIARTAAEIEAATLLAVATDVDAFSDAEARATSEEPGASPWGRGVSRHRAGGRQRMSGMADDKKERNT
jgi:hypothetical protein